MALIKCPGCGNDVSDYSHECPKCGEVIELKIKRRFNLKKEITSYLITTILLSIITISAGTFYIFTSGTYDFKLEIALFSSFSILFCTIKALFLWLKNNKDNDMN